MINALNQELQLFTLQDRVGAVIDYLQTEDLSSAFVVENELFLGAFSLELLLDLDSDKLLNNFAYLLKPDCILNDLHWFHAFELFSNFKSNVLAVVDEQQHYYGAYRFEELNSGILNLALIQQTGYIIVLNLDQNDAQYKPIVDIIERNGGRLLGVLTTVEDENNLELTIKIAIQNCDSVLDALTRASYQIVYSDASDHLKETLKDHAAYFNAYLNL